MKTNTLRRTPPCWHKLAIAVAWALVLIMTLALAPTTVLAAGIQAGTPTFAVNTASPTIVGFGGKQWAVIGHNGSGVASTIGTLTLLAKNHDFSTALFNAGEPSGPYNYDGGPLHIAMQGIYTAVNSGNAKESALILQRDVVAKDELPGTETTVSGQYFWPLSTSEANAVNSAIRVFAANWWLRSLGGAAGGDAAAYVGNSGSVNTNGLAVDFSAMAVRPAFYLDLSSVILTSDAASGKNVALGEMTAVTAPTGAVKFTVESSALDLNSVTYTGYDATEREVTFNYSGATAGETLSAIITNNSGAVTYYGQLADTIPASGSASVILPAGFNAAADTLSIIVEEINGDNLTDFCSTPLILDVPIHTVTFSVVGGGGALAAAVDGLDISSGDAVEKGKDVVFTATPNADYRVKAWTGITNGTNTTYTLTNLSADITVTVEFEKISPTDGDTNGGGGGTSGFTNPDMTPFYGVTKSDPDPKPETTSPADSPSDWAAAAVKKALELKLVPARLQGGWTADLSRAEFDV